MVFINSTEPKSLHGSHDQRSKSVIDALNRSFANENIQTSRSAANVLLTNKNISPLDPDGLVLIGDDGRKDVEDGNNVSRTRYFNISIRKISENKIDFLNY